MAVSTGPTLRADAARNRDALVTAATRVFGERGLDAPLDDIARLAGVGNATLYRHFPTRCDLAEAVFTQRTRVIVDAVDQALEEPDPWVGFCHYVRYICGIQAADAGLADLFARTVNFHGAELEQLRGQAYSKLTTLAARAKRAGALREDFEPEDLLLLLIANAGIAHQAGPAAVASSERFVAVVLDGLRADAATAGPPAPDASTLLEGLRSTTRVGPRPASS